MEKIDIIEEIDFGNDSDDANYKEMKTSSDQIPNMGLDFKESKKDFK